MEEEFIQNQERLKPQVSALISPVPFCLTTLGTDAPGESSEAPCLVPLRRRPACGALRRQQRAWLLGADGLEVFEVLVGCVALTVCAGLRIACVLGQEVGVMAPTRL